MKEAAEYAICYDVGDDRERGRVDKLLKGYGFRVQKSVFECRLTRAGKAALVAALSKLDLKTGSVKMYRVYAGTEAVVIGQPMQDPDGGHAYTL